MEGAGGAPGWSKEPVNHEGVRVNIDQGQRGDGAPAAGWALLRASLHDPLLVLNIESDVPGGECGCVWGSIRGRGEGRRRGLQGQGEEKGRQPHCSRGNSNGHEKEYHFNESLLVTV